MDVIATLGILLSATVFTTTIQAQDFEDIEGDLKIGRRTLPIVYPRLARYSMLVGLPMWSVTASGIWDLDMVMSGLLTTLSIFIGLRSVLFSDVDSDRTTYVWYNVSGSSGPRSRSCIVTCDPRCGYLLRTFFRLTTDIINRD